MSRDYKGSSPTWSASAARPIDELAVDVSPFHPRGRPATINRRLAVENPLARCAATSPSATPKSRTEMARGIKSRCRTRKCHRCHRASQDREQGVTHPVQKHNDSVNPRQWPQPSHSPRSNRSQAESSVQVNISQTSHSRNSNVGIGNQSPPARNMLTVGL